jgi:hypothetical protein
MQELRRWCARTWHVLALVTPSDDYMVPDFLKIWIFLENCVFEHHSTRPFRRVRNESCWTSHEL